MTPLKKINKEKYLSLYPCINSSHKKVMELFKQKEELGVLDIIPLVDDKSDLLWLLKPCLIEDKYIHLLMCDFVEHVIDNCRENKEELIYNIKLKRKWVNGQVTNKELRKQFLKSEIWLRRYVLSRLSSNVFLVAFMCRDLSQNPLELEWQIKQFKKLVNNVSN